MQIQNHEKDRFRGALLGLACGDAMGVSMQHADPSSTDPVARMLGGGPLDLQPGEWTRDTSFALCLAHSLLICHGFDPADQMDRYRLWLQQGYQSCIGTPETACATIVDALDRYRDTGYPYAGSNSCCTASNAPIVPG